MAKMMEGEGLSRAPRSYQRMTRVEEGEHAFVRVHMDGSVRPAKSGYFCVVLYSGDLRLGIWDLGDLGILGSGALGVMSLY